MNIELYTSDIHVLQNQGTDILRNSYALPRREQEEKSTTADRASDTTFVLTPIVQLMTRTVRAVRDDVPIRLCAELLLEQSLGALPVVDEHSRPVGLLSRSDLLRLHYGLHDQAAPPGRETWVRDVMSPVVFALPFTTPVLRASSTMVSGQLHHLIVVCSAGKLIGILSSLDILRFFSEKTESFAVGSPEEVND